MHTENYIQKDLFSITTRDGDPVDFDNELKMKISFFKHGDTFIAQKKDGILISTEKNAEHVNEIRKNFSERLKNSDLDWTLIEVSEKEGPNGLPGIAGFFKIDKIVQSAFSAGIIPGRNAKIWISVIISALLSAASVAIVFKYYPTAELMSVVMDFPFITFLLLNIILISIGRKCISFLYTHNRLIPHVIKESIAKNDPIVMDRLYLYFTDLVLDVLSRPLAIFVNDFSSLDPFTQKVLYNVMVPSDDKPHFGGLMMCICDHKNGSLFQLLSSDKKFSTATLQNKYSMLSIQ